MFKHALQNPLHCLEGQLVAVTSKEICLQRFLAILVCCLVGAALLIGCNTIAGPPAATSTPATYRPSINITRTDYNRAMTLWSSTGITEYELTVNELSLRSNNDYPETFRVTGDKVTFFRSILAAPTPFTMSRSDLDALGADNTIDGLFAKVADALSYTEQQTNIDSQTVFEVHFDPSFGYPIYFQTDCQERKAPQAGEAAYRCPSDTYLRVRTSDFKVLSRSTSLATPTLTILP